MKGWPGSLNTIWRSAVYRTLLIPKRWLFSFPLESRSLLRVFPQRAEVFCACRIWNLELRSALFRCQVSLYYWRIMPSLWLPRAGRKPPKNNSITVEGEQMLFQRCSTPLTTPPRCACGLLGSLALVRQRPPCLPTGRLPKLWLTAAMAPQFPVENCSLSTFPWSARPGRTHFYTFYYFPPPTHTQKHTFSFLPWLRISAVSDSCPVLAELLPLGEFG